MFFTYLLFIIIYLGFCNWIQIYYLLGNFIKPKHQLKTVDGKGLLFRLNKKTGLNLTIKTLSENKKAIGFMVSTPPFKPVMLFSERLYKLLSRDEFEWVALHESGHYLMWHTVKFALSQLFLGIIGILLINFLSGTSVMIIFPLVIILGTVYIQVAKVFEYQADFYSVTHMDNPRGMITGNLKMKKINKTLFGNKFLQKLLVIAVPYDERIKMAERQLKLTSKT
jgi:Zn-dependent protease with chaperone function